MQFIEEMTAAGWDPAAPNAQCIERTRRPQMPDYLSPLDKRGVHWLLLDLEFLRSFRTARDEKTPQGLVEVATLLHALRAEGFSIGDLDLESFKAIHDDVGQWLNERLKPSEERLNTAFAAKISQEEFDSRILEFEPAWTRNVLQLELKTTDWEGNKKAILEAIRRCELRGVAAIGQRAALRRGFGLSLTHEDVGGILPLLTAKNPGQPLYNVTSAGQFRLDPIRVRDALESVLGAVQPVREKRGRELPENVEELHPAGEMTPEREVTEVEQMVLLRQLLASKRDDAPNGSPLRVVLEHFEAINAGRLTVRQLAKRTGVSRQQLDRALAEVREELRRALGLPPHST